MSYSAFQQTIEDDFLQFDGIETVRFFRRTDEAGPTYEEVFRPELAPISGLSTRGTDEDEWFVSAIAPGKVGLIWHVLSSQVGTVQPRDRLTDAAGTTWEVVRVQLQARGVRYRLTCVRFQT